MNEIVQPHRIKGRDMMDWFELMIGIALMIYAVEGIIRTIRKDNGQ